MPARPLRRGTVNPTVPVPEQLSYKSNVANSVTTRLYTERGADRIEPAYELTRREGVELMRSKYCIRHELGLCPRQGKAVKAEPLFLRNGKERLCVRFDCAVCEMTVS